MSHQWYKATSDEIRQARNVDPTSVLMLYGFYVKWLASGKHAEVFSVDDMTKEYYRLTITEQGNFVCCDYTGGKVGKHSSTIDLVMDLDPTLSFGETILLLLYNFSFDLNAKKNIVFEEKFSTPKNEILIKLPSEEGSEICRNYLNKIRGIDPTVIDFAEQQKFLRYSKFAVLAIGYNDKNEIKNVCRRAISENDFFQKMDLKGSSKFYPQILRFNTESVLIVEGFIDALAALSINIRRNKPFPTVIVSGGAGILAFVKNPSVQEIFYRATKIIIFDDNEKDVSTQIRTDQGHQRQLEAINKIVGSSKAQRCKIDAKYKDLAELNLALSNSKKISSTN
jgi:hypothetical protein